MNSDRKAKVEVLYALPDEQTIVVIDYERGMTAAAAVERSGLAERFASIRKDELVLGVWGAEVEAGHRLEPGDRVEISRPLQSDPRDMRRELMSDGRVMGGASVGERTVKKKARE